MHLQIAFGQSNSLLSMGLADFRGENKGTYIELSWDLLNPAQEIDVIVERAGANGIFTPLGTASELNFLDKNPQETVHYYRLLAYDAAGNEMYSQIIAIEHDLSKEMKIVPNPATTFIDVGFYMEGNAAQIMIFDQQGSLVQQTSVESQQGGVQHFQLDLVEYNAGMYLLRVVEGIRATTMKFVVL